jgi:hypothetical protein
MLRKLGLCLVANGELVAFEVQFCGNIVSQLLEIKAES